MEKPSTPTTFLKKNNNVVEDDTARQTDRQSDRQTDRQTYILTYLIDHSPQ